MNIVTKVDAWRDVRNTLNAKSIGFVPTMGHLHAGHMSLCERARKENDVVVVSIFVNPTQFNQNTDFDLYPRTLEEDIEMLKNTVDYLFVPEAKDMYPDQYHIQLHETDISHVLEGVSRPGHFNGMLTVVLKLFNLIQPQHAYFGEKDYQQLLLIKKMVQALFLPIEIVACETQRAENGLALSSRNSRLNPEQQVKASYLSHVLQSPLTLEQMKAELQDSGFEVDYIEEKWRRRLAAVWLDGVRLIDNVAV